MKDNFKECLVDQRLLSTSVHDRKKSHALSRQITWPRCRVLYGRRLLRFLLLASVVLGTAGIIYIWRKPSCCATISTKAETSTSVKLKKSATSTGPSGTTALDLSWTTCPSHRELRTSQHFARWDKTLLQEVRGASQSLPRMEEESWHAVTNGIHVFSAFLTNTVVRAIHVVSLVQFRYSNGTSIKQPPLVCAVRASGGVTEHEARIRRVWTWLEPRLKSAFILCPAPALPEGDIQVAISVRGPSKRFPVWIPVHRPPEKSAEKCCAVCVRPTFGADISMWNVAEFIAHYRLMGARHIYLYDLEMSEELKLLLGHLQRRGVDVTIVPFKLLAGRSEVQANGQMPGLYDCIFRSLSKSEYFIHVDLDELMVPSQYSNISAMVHGEEAAHGTNVLGSIVVRSTYYCAEYPLSARSMQGRRVPLKTRMFTLHTKYGFYDSTKYVGRARAICNAGVHSVVQHCGSFKGVTAPISIAGVNHYRRCCQFAGADPIKRLLFNLWNPADLFRDDTFEERADLIEKELGAMGLREVLLPLSAA